MDISSTDGSSSRDVSICKLCETLKGRSTLVKTDNRLQHSEIHHRWLPGTDQNTLRDIFLKCFPNTSSNQDQDNGDRAGLSACKHTVTSNMEAQSTNHNADQDRSHSVAIGKNASVISNMDIAINIKDLVPVACNIELQKLKCVNISTTIYKNLFGKIAQIYCGFCHSIIDITCSNDILDHVTDNHVTANRYLWPFGDEVSQKIKITEESGQIYKPNLDFWLEAQIKLEACFNSDSWPTLPADTNSLAKIGNSIQADNIDCKDHIDLLDQNAIADKNANTESKITNKSISSDSASTKKRSKNIALLSDDQKSISDQRKMITSPQIKKPNEKMTKIFNHDQKSEATVKKLPNDQSDISLKNKSIKRKIVDDNVSIDPSGSQRKKVATEIGSPDQKSIAQVQQPIEPNRLASTKITSITPTNAVIVPTQLQQSTSSTANPKSISALDLFTQKDGRYHCKICPDQIFTHRYMANIHVLKIHKASPYKPINSASLSQNKPTVMIDAMPFPYKKRKRVDQPKSGSSGQSKIGKLRRQMRK